MKYIEKLLIALKGLMKWLIENISNEIENALNEDNMGQNKQKQENYKNSESLHPNDLVTEKKQRNQIILYGMTKNITKTKKGICVGSLKYGILVIQMLLITARIYGWLLGIISSYWNIKI